MVKESFRIKPNEKERVARIVTKKPELQLEGLSGVLHIAIREWCKAQEKALKIKPFSNVKDPAIFNGGAFGKFLTPNPLYLQACTI